MGKKKDIFWGALAHISWPAWGLHSIGRTQVNLRPNVFMKVLFGGTPGNFRLGDLKG